MIEDKKDWVANLSPHLIVNFTSAQPVLNRTLYLYILIKSFILKLITTQSLIISFCIILHLSYLLFRFLIIKWYTDLPWQLSKFQTPKTFFHSIFVRKKHKCEKRAKQNLSSRQKKPLFCPFSHKYLAFWLCVL